MYKSLVKIDKKAFVLLNKTFSSTPNIIANEEELAKGFFYTSLSVCHLNEISINKKLLKILLFHKKDKKFLNFLSSYPRWQEVLKRKNFFETQFKIFLLILILIYDKKYVIDKKNGHFIFNNIRSIDIRKVCNCFGNRHFFESVLNNINKPVFYPKFNKFSKKTTMKYKPLFFFDEDTKQLKILDTDFIFSHVSKSRRKTFKDKGGYGKINLKILSFLSKIKNSFLQKILIKTFLFWSIKKYKKIENLYKKEMQTYIFSSYIFIQKNTIKYIFSKEDKQKVNLTLESFIKAFFMQKQTRLMQ